MDLRLGSPPFLEGSHVVMMPPNTLTDDANQNGGEVQVSMYIVICLYYCNSNTSVSK